MRLPVLAALLLVWSSQALAQDASAGRSKDIERRAKVVAKIGEKSVTVGELEDRLAALPRFQLSMFGNDAESARRKFLEDVFVREMLLTAGATKQKSGGDVVIRQALTRAKAQATLRAIVANEGNPDKISKEDVAAYYQAHKNMFETKERYRIFRILCKSKEEALEVLSEVKKKPTLEEFSEEAREHSVDKTTYLRAGELGFVDEDGEGSAPSVKVDPAIVKAARSVKDGDFVAEPVREGEGFAVVWRRGRVNGAMRSVSDAEPQIRGLLSRERMDGAQKKLLEELRKKWAAESHEDLLPLIELPEVDAGLRRLPPLAPSK